MSESVALPNGNPPSVTYEELPLESLHDHEKNPRDITEEAQANLDRGLRRFGLVDTLVVNHRSPACGWEADSYVLVGGHQRTKLLRRQGHKTAHCMVGEWNPAEEAALLVLLNNPRAQGHFVQGDLDEVLRWLNVEDQELLLEATGYSSIQLASLLDELNKGLDTGDDEGKQGRGAPATHACPSCGHEFIPDANSRITGDD